MNAKKLFGSVLVGASLLALGSSQDAVAYGGGGTGVGGAGAGAGAGGGHGGGLSGGGLGAGHAGMGAVGFHTATFAGHTTGLRPITASYAGAPRYLPGGYGLSNQARLASFRPASQSGISRPVTATQELAGAGVSAPRTMAIARPRNAWTDPAGVVSARDAVETGGVKTAERQVTATQANESVGAYRNYIANGNYNGLTGPSGFAGTYLFPGTYGSSLNTFYNSQAPTGTLGYNGAVRSFAHNQQWFGPNAGYHAYWPNGYVPYFGGYAYPFFGSALGYDGFYGDGGLTADTDAAYGPPVASVDRMSSGPDQSSANNTEAQTQAPPAQQPTSPESDSKLTPGSAGNGPDSLVEAVQAELARRGYFTGKVDAMYGPSTREALRRFQTDMGLAATGRVNEATMHALRLD